MSRRNDIPCNSPLVRPLATPIKISKEPRKIAGKKLPVSSVRASPMRGILKRMSDKPTSPETVKTPSKIIVHSHETGKVLVKQLSQASIVKPYASTTSTNKNSGCSSNSNSHIINKAIKTEKGPKEVKESKEPLVLKIVILQWLKPIETQI